MRSEWNALLAVAAALIILGLLSYYESKPTISQLEKRSQELLKLSDANANESESMRHARIMLALDASWSESYTRGVLRDLAQACFVALVLLIVEFNTRRLARKDLQQHFRDVTQNTWEGVAGRLLGSKIANEVDEILKVNAAKEECQYNFIFENTITDTNGVLWVVVLVENKFRLRNLTGLPSQQFPLATSLIGFSQVGDYPRFVSVEVNGEKIPLENPDCKSFTHAVGLPASRQHKRDVRIMMRLAYRPSHSDTFITNAPIEQLNVNVENRIQNTVAAFKLEIIHTHADDIEETASLSWRFGRAILPGQGFSLIWREAEAPKQLLLPSAQAAKASG